jgi:hypothetical protein
MGYDLGLIRVPPILLASVPSLVGHWFPECLCVHLGLMFVPNVHFDELGVVFDPSSSHFPMLWKVKLVGLSLQTGIHTHLC